MEHNPSVRCGYPAEHISQRYMSLRGRIQTDHGGRTPPPSIQHAKPNTPKRYSLVPFCSRPVHSLSCRETCFDAALDQKEHFMAWLIPLSSGTTTPVPTPIYFYARNTGGTSYCLYFSTSGAPTGFSSGSVMLSEAPDIVVHRCSIVVRFR
jgi:hypothetical protein